MPPIIIIALAAVLAFAVYFAVASRNATAADQVRRHRDEHE